MENPGVDELAASLAAQASLSEAEERLLCRLCSVEPRSVILTACGHCLTCEACHREVMSRSKKCPLCNVLILEEGGVKRVRALGTSAETEAADAEGQVLPLMAVQSYMPEEVDAEAAERARAAADELQDPQRFQLELRRLAGVLAGAGDGDAAALLQATRELHVLLPRAQQAGFEDELLHASLQLHLPERLVALLQREDAPHELQSEALWLVSRIASGDSAATAAVLRAGALPVVVKLLETSPAADVRAQAVPALGNIAGDSPRCRDIVLAHGALQPLLAQIQDDSSVDMLRDATWALSNLCRGKPRPSFEAVRPALPTLARLVRSVDDDETLADACWALSYLAEDTNDKIAAVLDTGVCSRMVELLSHPNPGVLTPALRTVGNIATGNDEQTQSIVDCAVLPCLLRLLEDPHKKSIKKEACWTISNITAGNKDQVQAVIDANIVPPLIQLLASAEFDIKKEVAWALNNATSSGTHPQIRYLVSQGCIKPMCDLLTCSDTRIVALVLDTLENFLKVGACDRDESGGSVNHYATFVEESEGLEKIKLLKNHRNSDVNEKAVKVLETFFAGQDPDKS